MRRSFPQIHMLPVVVVWVETRVRMGCCLEYEGEWGQGFAFFLPIVSVKPRPVERTTSPFCIRPHHIMVHHLSRVTEKERRYVCTIDEQRKVPMDKVGTIHGEMWSEVRNSHSRHIYLILTQPVLGSDAWMTQIFSLVHKKALLGLLTFTVMDFNRPLVTFRRSTKEEATYLHAQIRGIVTYQKEEDWCAFLPAPTPPEGYTEAAQHRQSKHVGQTP